MNAGRFPAEPTPSGTWSWAFVAFRHVPGFPGYGVDSEGTVWSCRKVGRYGGILKAWHPLAPGKVGPYRYRCVHLRRNGETIPRYVHRLVLEAFIGPCPVGNEGCHFDGDTGNNKLANLRWDTSQANSEDGMAGGRTCQGERVAGAKLTADQVRQIRELRTTGLLQRQLAERFGISRPVVSVILSRKRWKHVS